MTATMTASKLPCPVCGDTMELRIATGRKSQKPFLMVLCQQDGRHFRGFIADKSYVEEVFKKAEAVEAENA